MKHFSYLVAIVLIMMVAISPGFASTKGQVKGVIPTIDQSQQQSTSFQGPISDPEIRQRSLANKGARVSSSVKALTMNPIPKVDGSSSITAGLSGTYHIPGDFPNISSAVAVLNFNGVAGATTFILDNSSYTEVSPVTFGAFPGAGTFTATIQPKAGVAVTVNFLPSASEGKGFAFNGATGVTIDGLNTGGASLTLQYAGGTFPAGDPFAATIYVTGGSKNISVTNTNIKGQIETSGAFVDQTDGRPAVFCYQDVGTANNNISITYCNITNATFGLKAISDYNVGYSQGPITYSHNNVGTAFGGTVMHGALVDIVTGMHYDYNVLDDITFVPYYWENGPTEYDGAASFADPSFLFDFGQPSAGHFYATTAGSTVSYNWVKSSTQTYNDGGFGFIIYGFLVRLGGAAGTTVHDNRIEGVHTTDLDGTDAGIRSESNSYHNSVRFTGTQTAAQTSYCYRSVGGDFKNNALSNERTGGAGSTIRCLQGTPGGASDGNAFFSANGRISTAATVNAYFATGKDANSQYGPIGFDASLHLLTFPSSAENIGRSRILLANDVDGTARDTSAAGIRDAGADEVLLTSGSPTAQDVMPTTIQAPNPAGIPFGLSQIPAATVKNNSTTATGSFNVTLTISGGYSDTKSVSLAGLETKTVTFASWSPAGPGSFVMGVKTAFGSDANAANDSVGRTQSVSLPHSIVGSETYWTAASADSWVGSGDFVLSAGPYTKAHIAAPYAGSTWITKASGNYTNAAMHTVTSQFYDLSTLGGDGNVYISFYQALATEPSWDRSWFQYSTDGATWTNLGALNDPNGVNWYSTGVYANAAGSDAAPDCWDGATVSGLGLWPDNGTVPPGWTSNGDCSPTGDDLHTGPDGYVYMQLKITPAAYPTVVGASIIKFRFVAFADAGSGDDGWAIDNLRIGGTGPSLPTATFSGNIYLDTDGSGGKNGGEAGLAGKIVDMKYFGVHIAYDTTDVNGDYSLTMGAPGSYTFNITNNTLGTSQPASGVYTYNYTSDAINVTAKDFGIYNGLISGRFFDDVNNDGIDGTDPGLSGWTVELHKDSCNGALVLSGVSVSGGAYTVAIGPGTYFMKQVNQAGWRASTPVCGGSVTVSGTSGGGTALVTGPKFGNFRLSEIRIYGGIDQNGNGVYDGGADNFALPAGIREIFEFKHNGVHVSFDTVGNGLIDFIAHPNQDTGAYSFTQLGTAPAGWARTLNFGGTFSSSITTSGQNPQTHFLDYSAPKVSGVKFNDLNGNGVKEGGEPALAGWTINLTGVGGGASVTNVLGEYSFSGVGGGAHVLSETPQAGWQATLPPSGSYALNVISAGLSPGDTTVTRNFGNFQKVSISGQKFRDRNGNGSKDPGDNGLAGWTINATNGGGSQPTDGSGNYTFSNLGPGTYVLSEVAQAGYVQTAPPGGTWSVTVTSGVNVTGKDFGNYQQGDSAKYRTWTYTEFKNATEAKPVKRPKAGKPITAPPNSANLILDLMSTPKITMSPIIQVGLSGQLVGGKEKGYILPGKQGEIYATFNTKGTTHTSAAKPLSFLNDGIKRLLKRYKSLPATKANNILVGDLLTFKINLAASAKGQTDPGLALGNLIYCEAGHAGLTGKSLTAISGYADSIMTNWDDRGLPGTPSAMWTDLDNVIAQINAAFSTGSTTDTALGWTAPKLTWVLAGTAQSTSFLCAPGPGIAPASTPTNSADEFTPLPTEYAVNQNYPNPFNPTTVIGFDLPMNSLVTVKVYNMLGQEVATLYDNEEIQAGTQEVDFDASALTSGVYFYRVTAQAVDDDGMMTGNTFAKTMKMMLVK